MNNEPWRPAMRLALVTASAIALGGCSGYRVGSMLGNEIRSVYVPIVVNRTTEPELEVRVTNALKQEFINDGTLAVNDSPAADATLNLTLTEFRLEALRYNRSEATTPSEYRLYLTGSFTLTQRSTGEAIVGPQRIKGDTWFAAESDMVSAKRDAVPKAAEDLAHRLIEQIVEAW